MCLPLPSPPPTTCQPQWPTFCSLTLPGWWQAQGLSTYHSLSLEGRPHNLHGAGSLSPGSTQMPPLRGPLAKAPLPPAPSTTRPSMSSPEHLSELSCLIYGPFQQENELLAGRDLQGPAQSQADKGPPQILAAAETPHPCSPASVIAIPAGPAGALSGHLV